MRVDICSCIHAAIVQPVTFFPFSLRVNQFIRSHPKDTGAVLITKLTKVYHSIMLDAILIIVVCFDSGCLDEWGVVTVSGPSRLARGIVVAFLCAAAQLPSSDLHFGIVSLSHLVIIYDWIRSTGFAWTIFLEVLFLIPAMTQRRRIQEFRSLPRNIQVNIKMTFHHSHSLVICTRTNCPPRSPNWNLG